MSSLFKVEPRFQKVVTASELYREMAQRNPGRVSQQAIFQAASMDQAGNAITGVTFFPPNSCNPSIVAPPAPRSHLMMAAATAAEMPIYFNWADSDNVAKVKKWKKRPSSLGPYTSPVFNQYSCGSCWAVSSAGVLSDRYAIYTQGPNPQFSPTDLLSCASQDINDVDYANCNKCFGGLPAGAAAYFKNVGVVPSTCSSYAWCERNRVCTGQQQVVGNDDAIARYLDKYVPRCSGSPCAQPSRFKVKQYRNTEPPKLQSLSTTPPPSANGTFALRRLDNSAAISISGVRDIQVEILANGPVVGAMQVWKDFQAGSLPGGAWLPTKGVYCNVQSDPNPYANTSYANFQGLQAGWHAVAIVGWGLEKDVNDWTMPGRKFDLPYWIVRNSWGTQWNPLCKVNDNKLTLPGYFKIAWTDPRRNINTEVFLDTAHPGQLGGATAFEPAVLRSNAPEDNGADGGGSSKKEKKYTFDAALNQCVPVSAGDAAAGSKVYDTAEQCTAAHPAATPLTYVCKYTSGKCEVRTDGSGKYATREECQDTCGQQHSTFLAVVITASIVVAAAIAIGVGVGVTRAKAKRGM